MRQCALREGTIAPRSRERNREWHVIAPCARSRVQALRDRNRRRYRWTAPSRGARASWRLPALRFFNRANTWRRRSALAHVNR